MTTFPGEFPTSSLTTNQSTQPSISGTDNSATPAVVTRGLVRVFGQKMAVNHLNLTVQRGEFFGFLGPNGAGKSTMLHAMEQPFSFRLTSWKLYSALLPGSVLFITA